MSQSLIVRTCLAVAAVLTFWGCASSADKAPALNAINGYHTATWTQDHWAVYLKDPASCTPCHGSTTDRTAAGGTSQVSCFGCHHPNGPHHTAGWADPEQHGRLGAQAVANGAFGFAGTGFAACTQCHGSTYTNPVGIAPSCESCHATAPHPVKPWTSTVPGKPSHYLTDQSNLTECVKCHAFGNNSDLKPVIKAPAGTTPGCYNGTLCHSF